MSTRPKNLKQQLVDSKEFVVEWPSAIVSGTETDNDLGPPLCQLLVDLGIKGSMPGEASADSPIAAVKGTPVSVSIIEAGATAASKGWATLIAALGGGTVVWGAVTNFWKSESAIQGTLVIGAAVVIAACTLGVALIMYGDVRARGLGAAAQYSARASIAAEFLRTAPAAAKMAGAPDILQLETKLHDGLTGIQTVVKAAQEQVSGVNDTAKQMLQATGTASDNMQNAIVTLALAQARDIDVPVVLKTGGSGSAKGVIRTSQGEWRFKLDGQTWMPVSQIAAFGDERNHDAPSGKNGNE